jgi:hypothetical protein
LLEVFEKSDEHHHSTAAPHAADSLLEAHSSYVLPRTHKLCHFSYSRLLRVHR